VTSCSDVRWTIAALHHDIGDLPAGISEMRQLIADVERGGIDFDLDYSRQTLAAWEAER
jgi:hypothetical protein